MEKANFGFMGLGVMGYMLALNMERNGFRVAGYDLDSEKVRAFGMKCPGKNLVACGSLNEFLAALERPRRIMMMIPAGKPVDAAIASLVNMLEPHSARPVSARSMSAVEQVRAFAKGGSARIQR